MGNPLCTNAGTKAVGPGRLVTLTPARKHALTNKNPGSWKSQGYPHPKSTPLTSRAEVVQQVDQLFGAHCACDKTWLAYRYCSV